MCKSRKCGLHSACVYVYICVYMHCSIAVHVCTRYTRCDFCWFINAFFTWENKGDPLSGIKNVCLLIGKFGEMYIIIVSLTFWVFPNCLKVLFKGGNNSKKIPVKVFHGKGNFKGNCFPCFWCFIMVLMYYSLNFGKGVKYCISPSSVSRCGSG